ncbi:MAG: OmpH family outer membrane protein [Gammaproteobacteria bacterium]|nr:OmpH family outer membrane protein [Gammaproteobacteria bacterium]
MKKFNVSFVFVVLFAVFSGYSGSVFAELKIGFVDVVKLSESAPQIRSAQTKMDAEFGSREKEIIALQREIEAMEEALARDGAVMSDAERSKKERAILGKRREGKRAQDEFRDDINIRRNEILRKVNTEIGKAIEAYAKRNNFDLILAQGVMYNSDKVDITENVLKELGGS